MGTAVALWVAVPVMVALAVEMVAMDGADACVRGWGRGRGGARD